VQAGDAKTLRLPTPYYFLPRRPPALNSQEYADAVNEINKPLVCHQHRAYRRADAAGTPVGQRRLQGKLGGHLEPGDALHDAEKQPRR
jgi:hypothetical protein